MSTTVGTVSLERVGSRVYLVNLPFDAKDRAKAALGMNGGNFDRDRKQWWVGGAKLIAAEKFVAEFNAAPPAAPAPEDVDNIRLVAKAKYKGRTCYVRCFSGDGRRCRLTDFDGKMDVWADVGNAGDEREDGPPLAVIEKTYPPREVSAGHYRNGYRKMEHMTLGKIRRFVEKIKKDEAAMKCGTAETKQCWECGGAFTELQARTGGGDWSDSYCGC